MNHSSDPDRQPVFFEVGHDQSARRIAVRAREGAAPGLFWLGGFALDAWAAEHGRACVRFDYSGHGESSGQFAEGTIGRWLQESVAVFERFCSGPQVVIGSSMGGWMALLLAREIAKGTDKGTDKGKGAKAASLAGLVLIAPAPDFTEELMWKGFSPEIRDQIEQTGVGLR